MYCRLIQVFKSLKKYTIFLWSFLIILCSAFFLGKHRKQRSGGAPVACGGDLKEKLIPG